MDDIVTVPTRYNVRHVRTRCAGAALADARERLMCVNVHPLSDRVIE